MPDAEERRAWVLLIPLPPSLEEQRGVRGPLHPTLPPEARHEFVDVVAPGMMALMSTVEVRPEQARWFTSHLPYADGAISALAQAGVHPPTGPAGEGLPPLCRLPQWQPRGWGVLTGHSGLSGLAEADLPALGRESGDAFADRVSAGVDAFTFALHTWRVPLGVILVDEEVMDHIVAHLDAEVSGMPRWSDLLAERKQEASTGARRGRTPWPALREVVL
ncbi:hypothetical protein M8A51_23100 [Schlegelella sp. S2-27]|uniref:Uncharacterized protein n=1 Tax=Caldimonas mangrovi TaxID=2944811 RepID=A0ABT0YWA9_9BURK|nr:hypothetical protein [Caldimonas mangrovi]MCM5682426.1 hypothetical protein [Caldimonas mangrovi]